MIEYALKSMLETHNDLFYKVIVGAYLDRQIRKLPQSDISWISPYYFETLEEKKLFRQIGLYLGKGEASCLSIAIMRKYKLLIDDWDARNVD